MDDESGSPQLIQSGIPMRRFHLRLSRVLVFAAAALAGQSALAQPKATGAKGEPLRVPLTTGDGQTIVTTYYPVLDKAASGGAENAGVVILLHGDDKGRIQWDQLSGFRGGNETRPTAFPYELQNQGYAVVSVDLRKYGESNAAGEGVKLRPVDYEAMVEQDLVAVKKLIFEEHQNHQLNMAKMAIVASGPTAPVAARFALIDWNLPPYDDAPVAANKTPRGQDIRALVLLSPEGGAGRLATAATIRDLRSPIFGVAMLVIVGKQDPNDKGQAKRIFDLMAAGQKKDEAERVYMLTPNLKDRGVLMMGKVKDQVEGPILTFLDRHLRQLDVPWRDRRNKVTE